MRILVLGASGRVGRVIVKKALLDGHSTTAFVRDKRKFPFTHPHLDIFEGNVLNDKDLMDVLLDTEIVFSALNSGNQKTLQNSMPLIIDAMKINGVNRIITVGTAGIFDSRIEQGCYRYQTSESKRKSTMAAEDHLAAYQFLCSSGLNWTLVCPTYMPDGEETGTYRVEKDRLPVNGESISVADTAAFAYETKNKSEFFRTRVGISY